MRRVFRLFRGDRPARGRRARVRWTIRLLFVLVLLVTVGGVLVLRSPVVAWVLASRLESTLGAQMESKGAVVNPGGSLIITGLRLRVPGVGGGAGEFLSAERVEVDLDWSGVWSGKVVPIGVRLYEPVFRVSLSTRDNSVNLAHLAARAGEGGGPGPAPRVDVIDGAVEFGEHEPGRYTALGVIPVTGSLTPLHRARPVYSVKLQQTGEPPSRVHGVRRVGGDMLLEGRVDLNESRGELRLHHFDLAAWPAGALPSGVRDIWASLAMRGQVTRSTFSYDDETGPQVRLEVRGVAMNVPVPADRPDAAPMEPMNLQGVSGDVRLSARGLAASLEGVIEDLPVRVSLRTEGTELNAALRCEILAERFTLRQSPDLLPYAPRVVRKRFAEFSGPTAVVDARVLLERGPPIGGVAAPLSASGTVAFDNGRAVFRDFPYPFEQVSGLVTFDEQGVHIVRVNGVGPTGARLLATGELTAPMDGPAVAIDVLVRGVALDPVLEAALEDKRGILEDLFNRRAYRRLLDEGLVISGRTSRELGLELAALRERRRAADQDPAGPERGADLDRQIAAIERRLGVPVFDLGGEADILVMVRAAAGKKQPVHHQVQVVIREAGMLPAAFPHPVMARDVIFQLDQDELRLIEGDFAGLTGGTAQVAARVLLETKARRHAEPHIQVRAVDVPIDGLLVRAIPEEFAAPRTEREQAGPAREPEGFSGKRLLENLRVEGTVACDVVIAPAGEGETTSDVRVRFADLAAIPRPRGPEPIGPPAGGGADTLAVTGLRGQVHIAGDEVTIPECEADLHRAWSHDPRGPVQALGPPAGHVALALTARLAEPSATTPAPLYASLLVSDLDLTSPMEDLIAVADPGVARSVADLLEARRPAGVLDAEVEVTRHASERPAVWLHLSNGRGVEADVLGDRLGVDLEAGSVTLHSGPPTSLHFDAAVARLSFAGQPAGSLRLDGRLALPSGAASPDPETALAVRAENATLEAPLVRLLVREAAPGARDLLDDLDPAGEFDAVVTVRPALGDPGGGGTYRVAGAVTPHRLELTRAGTRIGFHTVTGRIEFDGAHGWLERLAAHSDDFSAYAFGEFGTGAAPWAGDAARGGWLDVDLGLTATTITDELRALLPGPVHRVLGEIGLTGGPLRLEGGTTWVRAGPGGEPRLDRFEGTVVFEDAAFSVGLPVTEAAGQLEILAARDERDAELKAESWLTCSGLRLLNVPLTGVSADLRWGAPPGVLSMPSLAGDCLGGRVFATAVLETGAASPSYRVSLAVAGARFAPLLASLGVGAEAAESEPAVDPEDVSRGNLDASVSVAGVPGDPARRTGRGALRIAEGRVVELPFILRLIELSNFQLPGGDELDYAQATFTLLGRRVHFDQLAVMSSRVSILGAGSVTLPELAADLRFTSQSARRMPVISDVLELVRNEIISTRVTGTLAEPRYSSEILGGTRRMLGRVFRPGGAAPASFSRSAERAARLERRRVREAASPGPGAGSAAIMPVGGAGRAAAGDLP